MLLMLMLLRGPVGVVLSLSGEEREEDKGSEERDGSRGADLRAMESSSAQSAVVLVAVWTGCLGSGARVSRMRDWRKSLVLGRGGLRGSSAGLGAVEENALECGSWGWMGAMVVVDLGWFEVR